METGYLDVTSWTTYHSFNVFLRLLLTVFLQLVAIYSTSFVASAFHLCLHFTLMHYIHLQSYRKHVEEISVSGGSRFSDSEKDHYFLKIPKWKHELVQNQKQGKLVSYFLNNGAKNLYKLKISENIEIELVFHFKAFFHLTSNLHTSCFSAFKTFVLLSCFLT